MSGEPGRRYCGRELSTADLAHIRQLLQIKPVLGRVALSRRVCQDLGWLNSLGQPKEMSARVALLRMEKDQTSVEPRQTGSKRNRLNSPTTARHLPRRLRNSLELKVCFRK